MTRKTGRTARTLGAQLARCLALLLVLGQLALLAHRIEHTVDAAPDGHAAACVFCAPIIDPPGAPFVEPPVQQAVALAAVSGVDLPAPAMRATLGFRALAPPHDFPFDQHVLNDIG